MRILAKILSLVVLAIIVFGAISCKPKRKLAQNSSGRAGTYTLADKEGKVSFKAINI